MQQLVQCYKCGEQNNLGNKFCIRCGEPFHYKCPQCRANISTDYSACPNCGVALDWGIKTEQADEFESVSAGDKSPGKGRKKADRKRSSSRIQRNRATPWLIGFVVIVLCITAAFAIDSLCQGKFDQSTPQSSTPGQGEIPLEITAEELSSDYAMDEMAADKLYKGNILKVTGKVSSVNKNLMGVYFIKLSGGGIEDWEIQCTFDKQNSSDIADVVPNDTVTIMGTCDGYFMSVKMKDCMLLH
jgi:hypothetical protein